MNISYAPPPTVCVPPELVMLPLLLWPTYWDWLTVRFFPGTRDKADPIGPDPSTARFCAVIVRFPLLQLKRAGLESVSIEAMVSAPPLMVSDVPLVFQIFSAPLTVVVVPLLMVKIPVPPGAPIFPPTDSAPVIPSVPVPL